MKRIQKPMLTHSLQNPPSFPLLPSVNISFSRAHHLRGKKSPSTITTAITQSRTAPKPEDIYQIILHNDDTVAAEHVVQCLINVFKHDMTMAMKIMFEAHNSGRAIAEVEGESAAKQHAQELSSAKLTVTLEKV